MKLSLNCENVPQPTTLLTGMDPFASLTVGVFFDKNRDARAIKVFRQPGNAVQAAVSQLTSDHSHLKVKESALNVPPPAPTLAIFGHKENSSGTVCEHQVPPAVDDANGRHVPIKPMSRKRLINIWRKHSLLVDGTDIPSPIEHFSSLVRPPLNAPQHVVDVLFQRNHKIPTAVQVQAIPTLLSGRDLLACAPTGSGKTLAYLIPLFARLREPSVTSGVRAVVVAPTMELAMQIEREAFFLMKGARWKFVQHGQTTKNKDIFITTPQRVASMIDNKLVDLGNVEFLVFDEGDKLWEPSAGFLNLTDKVVAACSKPSKVVALFTATLSEKVEEAARSVMSSDAIRVIVRGRTVANKDVDQRLVFCGNELGKVVAMRNLIREGLTPPVLIFVQSIERTKELADELRCNGLHLAIMNSKMSTEERDATVTNFRLGKIWVLITTELLSRGIDFKHIGTVINFDFPTTSESYIHRIGRTGRAGNKGLAITFFTEDDRERLPPIVKIAVESGSTVDDWLLALKVPKKRQRQLARQTPQRMIVSTQKRILVGEQRIQRQIKAAERERAEAKTSENGDDEDDDDN